MRWIYAFPFVGEGGGSEGDDGWGFGSSHREEPLPPELRSSGAGRAFAVLAESLRGAGKRAVRFTTHARCAILNPSKPQKIIPTPRPIRMLII